MGWQRGTLSELFGQRVIYRNLAPVDADLPGLARLWPQVGLDRYVIPRKTSMEYARTVWLILQAAQQRRGVCQPVERVLLIGDSARNDGAVARNMSQEHAARAFIGLDALDQPRSMEITRLCMTANRWDGLADMIPWLLHSGFACDEGLAVLVDIDKTSIGARGRNDRTIDLARVRAAERTAASALGDAYDAASFRQLYAHLNRTECHWLTEDNQDYVAYLSLILASGTYPEDSFWDLVRAGQGTSIVDLAEHSEAHLSEMPAGLRRVQQEVRQGLYDQDPTPFKSFRRDEFRETISLMDALPEDTSAEAVLQGEIVITAEIADICRYLTGQGAVVFGLSDKPDEASLPDPEAAGTGYRAIHDTTMKVYGEHLF